MEGHGGIRQSISVLLSLRYKFWKNQLSSCGYASINYRLPPLPSHATDPSSPDDRSRNTKHPDHVNDVTKALLFLEQNYGIYELYVLSATVAELLWPFKF